VREPLRQSDRRDSFAFAGDRWRSRGDENHSAARLRERGIVQQFKSDFRAVRTDLFDVLIGDFEFLRDVFDREKGFGHESSRCVGWAFR
jgi:hypothetical protein